MKRELDDYEAKSRRETNILFAFFAFMAIALVTDVYFLYNRSQERKGIVPSSTKVVGRVETTIQPTSTPTITKKQSKKKLKVEKITDVVKKKSILQEHTVYHKSNYNRDNNLKIAAKMLSNTVILPGEEFSFFEIIGEPNEQKGFKEAGVIINHKSATALGGGICEVATSLNTVVVNAGIKTNARNHSVNVGYLNSTDHEATVTYDSRIDLKFTNTLKYPIMIEQSVKGGNVTTKLFKVKVVKKVTLKDSSTGEKSVEKLLAKKMLAADKKVKSEFNFKFDKTKSYYLKPSDFLKTDFKNIKKSEDVVNSLKKIAGITNLDITESSEGKSIVKNNNRFPIIIKISYNSYGEEETAVIKLK